MEDAKMYEEQDKKLREQIESKNNAESMVYTADHMLEEYKDKIKKEDAEKINTAKSELQDAIKKEDYDSIKNAMAALQKVLGDIGSDLYKGAEGAQQGAPGAPGNDSGKDHGDGDSTADTDFKVEK